MTTPSRAVAALTASAQQRTTMATRRAEQTIRRLVTDGRPVTVAAVAREAGVSTDFLYRHAQLRQRILQLRDQNRTPPAPLPVPKVDDPSIVLLLKQRLASERVARLEAERLLAIAHGELIALRRQT